MIPPVDFHAVCLRWNGCPGSRPAGLSEEFQLDQETAQSLWLFLRTGCRKGALGFVTGIHTIVIASSAATIHAVVVVGCISEDDAS
jgi:hypothetical protein